MIPYSFIDWVNKSLQPEQPVDPTPVRESLVELIVSVHELNTRIDRLDRRLEQVEIVRRSPWTRG